MSTSPKNIWASYLIGTLLGNRDYPLRALEGDRLPGHCYGGGAMGAITAVHPL